MIPTGQSSAVALRAQVSLAASAVVVAAATGSALLLVRWATGEPSFPVMVLTVVVPAALLWPIAGLVAGPRRVSGPATTVAAWVVATALAIMAGVAGTVLLLGRLPDHGEGELMGAATAGIALAAVLAVPSARRVSPALRRWAPPPARLPDDLLAVFSSRSAHGAELAELLRELAEALRRHWQLSAVHLWTAEEGALRCSVSVPRSTEPPGDVGATDIRLLRRVSVAGSGWLHSWLPGLLQGRTACELRLAPAVHGRDVLALVVVERDDNADRFHEAEERALLEVAQRLAMVLRNRELDEQLEDTLRDLRRINQQLEESSSRLVTAADAARAAIERDLHDGAQAHITGLVAAIGRVRDSVCRAARFGDRERAACLADLDALTERVKEAADALRNLAHGIYPAVLTDFGLRAALKAVAARSPAPVTVDVPDSTRYPPGVEAAVYFCCAEALQNAAKHAPGASMSVRLWASEGRLHLMVRDDGPGFDPASVHRGRGLLNMEDRMRALGGELTWESEPGAGTTVCGYVPLCKEE
ncbi:GAF domain-containing sensor histidine kinase [Streptomyces sp. NPDC001046]|uniref:GAF domain-containing sensor histidine kinase n=1 Tax=Streptomyces sp. NPDC001046 TaxID=3364543 RepID=UPI0036B41AAC